MKVSTKGHQVGRGDELSDFGKKHVDVVFAFTLCLHIAARTVREFSGNDYLDSRKKYTVQYILYYRYTVYILYIHSVYIIKNVSSHKFPDGAQEFCYLQSRLYQLRPTEKFLHGF